MDTKTRENIGLWLDDVRELINRTRIPPLHRRAIYDKLDKIEEAIK